MSKTFKRLAITGVAATAAAGLLLVGSCVKPTVAKAGGLGNFYKYKTCAAKTRAGETVSGLNGLLSNYDIHNYQDQRYHHGVKVSRTGWRLVTPPIYDDESWPITKDEIWDALGWSGYWHDGTQDFAIMSTQHTVTFIFGNGNITAKCSIRE